MREYNYKISVIVPVYNVHDYLRSCLDSLAAQTIDHSELEVLLINDGSTDDSLNICYEYAQIDPIFKVFDKSNEGVSATRNFGIQKACGKYIMFLDSDDTYTPNTIKLVTDFFDAHYEEVDLVSYYDQYYENGQPLPAHVRYKYLTHTGIYDLQKDVFAMQVRLNICVKNMFEKNYLFDEEMMYQEDQKYCCNILKEKLKMGFVKEAQYNYMKNSEGIVMSSTNVITIFDHSISFFEEIFNNFPDHVPEYFQQLFIHDCGWKLKQHCLFPYHYDGEEFEKQYSRLIALMERLDIDAILKAPTMDTFHKYYILQLTHRDKMMVYPDHNQLYVMYDENVLRTEKSCEIICQKIKEKNNKLMLLAMFKSVYGAFISKPKVYVREYWKSEINEKELDTFISSDSYYKAREVTNVFWGFYYETDLKSIDKFEFFVEICGVSYPVRYYFMPNTALFKPAKHKSIPIGDYSLSFENNIFSVKPLDYNNKIALINSHTKGLKDATIIAIRNETIKYIGKRIWLYYDCKNVKGDNGYYQFEHDAFLDDGVERYYISNNPPEFMREYVRSDLYTKVVMYGSVWHKILFASAEKILTAYVEPYNYNPLTTNEYNQLSDLLHYELIYLQHGILHATLPWKYTPERSLADKVVVSSYFEIENFKNNYNFREQDILPTGMGRFNRITPKNPHKKNKPYRILFAPTWRQYLIAQAPDGTWIPEEKKFIESSYYKHFNDFLNDPELIEALEKNNCIIELKLHPIFEVYEELFTVDSERIKIVTSIDNQNDYDMFITDFSSFTFDFAFCKLPIMYFVPDMYEFKAGLNQYRKLDLTFENAFGPLVTDAQEAVIEIKKEIDMNFEPAPIYKKRMDEFYLPMEDCCGKLYDLLISEKMESNHETNSFKSSSVTV